jgi:hypothetical protein
MAKRGSPSMAAGQGGGYRGLAGWGEARPMVSGGPVGVSGKRWVREWGFEAGQALTNGCAPLVPAVGRTAGYLRCRPQAVGRFQLLREGLINATA